MRIVTGLYRGARIEAPPDDRVRPTSDRARESIFNMLEGGRFSDDGGSLLPDARILDAFCGTGAMAIEALSRGAAEAVLVDSDRAVLRLAKSNVERIVGQSATRFIAADSTERNATGPGPADQPATIAFLDPPYGEESAGLESIGALRDLGWIDPGTLIVLETPARKPLALSDDLLTLDVRRYGAARIAMLRVRGR